MSEPKRYTCKVWNTCCDRMDACLADGEKDAPEGEYVRYEDYARLKAEVERLTEQKEHLWNKCTPHMKAGYETHELLLKQARAKAMRLEKVGDAMAKAINEPFIDPSIGWDTKHLARCWNAAKEGKQP